MNNETRIFISWGAPTALFLSPVLLGAVIYRLIQDSKIGKEVNLFDPNLIFIFSFCIGGFLFSLYICRVHLGWFSKKH